MFETHNTKSTQNLLFSEVPFNTKVITKKKDFDGLFDGFNRMQAISYVVSPDVLVDWIQNKGYEYIEILVGENLSAPYRQHLEKKGVDAVEVLQDYMTKQMLKVWFPPKTVHSKLYILSHATKSRIIQTSANLTETARRASRQTNYAWYADFDAQHPWLNKILKDYQTHLLGCEVFMDDLNQLLQKDKETPRTELIEAWLKGYTNEAVDSKIRESLHQLTLDTLQLDPQSTEEVISIKLVEGSTARRQIEKLLAPMKPIMTQDQIQIKGSDYIRYVEQSQGFPLMRVDDEKQSICLGIKGNVISRSQNLPQDGQTINDALNHIEEYISTVQWGHSQDKHLAMMSMYEAFLYIISSPFACEFMKVKRKRFGILDRRGPRFMYIYGPAQNGKSTFLRFALKLMTGHHIEPLSGPDFTKRRIQNTQTLGTIFPLVFDDLNPLQKSGFEDVLKSYWEVWWDEETFAPQIIISSNVFSLKDWAKSRTKRVDFDVHFYPDEENKEKLATIFKKENNLFLWFSHLYLKQINSSNISADDEISIGRDVMTKLYKHANRPMPSYFPQRPIEQIIDPGQRLWKDLIYELKKAKVKFEKRRTLVEFSEDFQGYEIREYLGCLPQNIKHRLRGKTLVIESPKDFKSWLKPNTKSWISKLFHK